MKNVAIFTAYVMAWAIIGLLLRVVAVLLLVGGIWLYFFLDEINPIYSRLFEFALFTIIALGYLFVLSIIYQILRSAIFRKISFKLKIETQVDAPKKTDEKRQVFFQVCSSRYVL